MNVGKRAVTILAAVCGLAVLSTGCRNEMPHSFFTWPSTGTVEQTHAKPPQSGYLKDWDPYARELLVEPHEATNPVSTQHVIVATVNDEYGEPLPNRRVEWILSRGGVGDIVEVDESGWRASRGYKVSNQYAISHTANRDRVLTMGTDDPSDDITIHRGQTWCVITSPVEGDTHVTVYCPAIYDWNKHKVFVTKHWYDVQWMFPEPATNPVGTTHEFTTLVTQASDGAPLPGYEVTYKIVDGPAGSFDGKQTVTVETDASGAATVTLKQDSPVAGTNNIEVDIVRPANEQCCLPGAHIATGMTSKTWVAPKIAITKDAPAQKALGDQFQYDINVSNPSTVTATDVKVTDVLPNGIAYVSSTPAASVSGQTLTWSLGEVAGGGNASIRVLVKGTQTGDFNNCAEVNANMGLTARDCATTRIVNAKLVLEKTCQPEAMLCDEIPFKVVVRNTGDGPATNVQITDELPAGLTTTDGKSTMLFNAGTLEAGQAKQATFTVKADKPGTYTNRAKVTADGGLTAEDSCETIVRQPVLQVTKEGPDMRFVGRPVAYKVTVKNTGDSPANNTVLTDRLPSGVELLSASGDPQQGQGTLTWRLGTLAPGEAKSFDVSVKSNTAGTLKNCANATADCAEASECIDTEVKGIPAILLEVVDIEDPIEVGSNVQYVITVTNQGSAVGTNIKIVATLPAEQDYVASDGPTQATVDGKDVTFAPLPSLAPKARATFRVTTKGNAAADTRFKVVMTSDQISSPVQETEATNVY
ncbi:MAG: DUF11 domain-containing protein [Phycisphaerales bacterium]|nr:DUF11 domain-containing protein [Phycisphaerales bacterium]